MNDFFEDMLSFFLRVMGWVLALTAIFSLFWFYIVFTT